MATEALSKDIVQLIIERLNVFDALCFIRASRRFYYEQPLNWRLLASRWKADAEWTHETLTGRDRLFALLREGLCRHFLDGEITSRYNAEYKASIRTVRVVPQDADMLWVALRVRAKGDGVIDHS